VCDNFADEFAMTFNAKKSKCFICRASIKKAEFWTEIKYETN